MPEGIVKGPETVLPRNSVFNWDRSSWFMVEFTQSTIIPISEN